VMLQQSLAKSEKVKLVPVFWEAARGL